MRHEMNALSLCCALSEVISCVISHMRAGRCCIWVSDTAGRPETHPPTMAEGHTQVCQHTAAQGGSYHVGWSRHWREQRHLWRNPFRTPWWVSPHRVLCGWTWKAEKARANSSPLCCNQSSPHPGDLISESSCALTSHSFNCASSGSPLN